MQPVVGNWRSGEIAKLATGNERALVHDLKVWWRHAASHLELSQLAGAEVPAEVIQVSPSQPLSDEGRKLYRAPGIGIAWPCRCVWLT